MELKLLVRTHKKKFGSILNFSQNISPRERNVLENIRYTGYEANESQIIEICSSNYFVYFCTYMGGQDEYGRDYQNVIAAIFPFKLNDSDILNLRKTFKDIMKDIYNDNFSQDSRYFSEIKNKQSQHTKTTDKKKINFTINYKKLGFSIALLIGILLFIYTVIILFNTISEKPKSETNSQSVVIKTENDYDILKKSIKSSNSALEKYNLYNEFIEKIKNEAEPLKSEADDSLYNEILKNSKDNNENKLSEKIALYNKYGFIKHKSDINKLINNEKDNNEKDKTITLNSVENKVINYNKNPESDNLKSILSLSKSALIDASSADRIRLKSIIYQADNIKKGINNEIEIYISDKSSVFNRKTFTFEISIDDSITQSKTKPLTSDKDIYIGSFFVKLSPFSTIKFKILDHGYDGKKSTLKNMEFSFDDLNRKKMITDSNGNSFLLELRIIKDHFKIKR